MRYPLLLMSLYCDACMFVWFVSERLHDATAALPVGMDRGCTEMEGNTGDVIVESKGQLGRQLLSRTLLQNIVKRNSTKP